MTAKTKKIKLFQKAIKISYRELARLIYPLEFRRKSRNFKSIFLEASFSEKNLMAFKHDWKAFNVSLKWIRWLCVDASSASKTKKYKT